MEKIIRFSDIPVEVSSRDVLDYMQCYEDSPVYEDVVREYQEIRDELLSLVKPEALFCFGEMPRELESREVPAGTPVIFSLITGGGEVSKYSTRMFQEDDYVKGMIADALAGAYLWSLEKAAIALLKKECALRHVGISKRMEAPADMPMTAQKIIYEKCDAGKELGMGITSGYMYDPVKSSGLILVLSKDENLFQAQHDCRTCKAVNCKMRKVQGVKIRVKNREEEYEISCEKGQTITEAMEKNGRYFSAFCGGKGTCGKCRMRVVSGNLPVNQWDRKHFSQEELEAGWRLACKAVPDEDCVISFCPDDESGFEAAASFGNGGEEMAEKAASGEAGYGIAVDIGTTTIALSLTDLGTGESREVYTAVNRQRMYGADVIARIQASNDGKGEELRAAIQKDLCEGIRKLLEKTALSPAEIKKLVIAGNTTMGHLLMGFSCEGLGVYPFTPVDISTITGSCREILGQDILSCPITLMPGISTYVGADITAGILACKMAETEEISLLIDLGTNGEMALGNKEKLYVTSTAAGPAFEGGNISCGMGSIQGAVCSVKISEDGSVQTETIGNQPALGLCGTGVIETIAELVERELVDETGLLDEEYEEGFPLGQTPEGRDILFTRKDIREIQLAKSAVRAGMETLMLRYGVTCDQIKQVYLAGGFGLKINQDKAIAIGMLPEEFKGRIHAVGNSSLGGAIRYLSSEEAGKTAEKIIAASTEISLSADKDFNEFYMDYMFFE